MQEFFKAARADGWEGENNPRWNTKGSYQRARDGRWMLRDGKRWRLRYRVVAEKKIGRKLKPNEIVHHVDGNPSNDAPDNLQVMTRAEHRKQHPSMDKKRKFNFDPAYIRERLRSMSRTKLAKELGCNRWVLRQILGELA